MGEGCNRKVHPSFVLKRRRVAGPDGLFCNLAKCSMADGCLSEGSDELPDEVAAKHEFGNRPQQETYKRAYA